ncbi:hypothetical protein D3C78_1824360 [compost metagenome]
MISLKVFDAMPSFLARSAWRISFFARAMSVDFLMFIGASVGLMEPILIPLIDRVKQIIGVATRK